MHQQHKLPRKLAYITNPAFRAALESGNPNCTEAVNGIKNPLQTDLQAMGISQTNIQQEARDYLVTAINKFLKTLMGR